MAGRDKLSPVGGPRPVGDILDEITSVQLEDLGLWDLWVMSLRKSIETGSRAEACEGITCKKLTMGVCACMCFGGNSVQLENPGPVGTTFKKTILWR